MTLFDLFCLIRHKSKMFISIVVVCTIVAAGLGVVKNGSQQEEFTATSVLTVSEPTATVSSSELIPLTTAIANVVVDEESQDRVSISVESDLADRSIAFTVTSPDEATSKELSSMVAWRTVDETQVVLGEMSESFRQELPDGDYDDKDGFGELDLSVRVKAAALGSVQFTVNTPSSSVGASTAFGIAKMAFMGLAAGCILAVCIILFSEMAHASVMGRKNIEETFGLPVLAQGPADKVAEYLWKNLVYSMGDAPRSVCLIPVGRYPVDKLFSALVSVVSGMDRNDAGCDIKVCRSLARVEGIDDARTSDAIVLCLVPWESSLEECYRAQDELLLIGSKLTGFVLEDNTR